MLAGRVIDQHHGETELPGPVHGLEPEYAGGGLLTASYHARNELRVAAVYHVDQVSSVVDYDVRRRLDDFPDAPEVLLVARPVEGEHLEPLVREGGGDIVLGAERIAAGHVHLGPAGGEDLAQMRRLRLKMN